MTKYFGTDGIRGSYGSRNMNENFAQKVGWAISHFLIQTGYPNPVVAVGSDTRPSSPTLKESLIRGLQTGGAIVKDFGIIPTPALAFGVIQNAFHFGVMITASHNPYLDNGIKCFSGNGTKLSKAQEEEIEQTIDRYSSISPETSGVETLSVLQEYLHNLKKYFCGLNLSGMRIALDSANGATCQTSQTLLEELGATVFAIHQGGGMINENCGSEHLEDLRDLVLENKADLGIAHDGDGDRVRFINTTGQIVDGDQVLGLLALHAHRSESLSSSSFVTTVHSNSGLSDALQKTGIKLERSDVGDRNVFLKMLESQCNWGGESSGHIINTDYLPTGDGLFAALSVLLAIQNQSRDLSSLSDEIKLWPLRSESFPVSKKTPIQDVPAITHCIEDEEKILGNRGRILLRYSGTEPKIRLLVEGVSEDLISESFNRIQLVLQKSL
jgi:phosphoglucosamine mutase